MNRRCPRCNQEMCEVYPCVWVCPKEHVWEGSTYLTGVFGLAGYLAVRLREMKDAATVEVAPPASEP